MGETLQVNYVLCYKLIPTIKILPNAIHYFLELSVVDSSTAIDTMYPISPLFLPPIVTLSLHRQVLHTPLPTQLRTKSISSLSAPIISCLHFKMHPLSESIHSSAQSFHHLFSHTLSMIFHHPSNLCQLLVRINLDFRPIL